MTHSQRLQIAEAILFLGAALADYQHVWSDAERTMIERALDLLEPESTAVVKAIGRLRN